MRNYERRLRLLEQQLRTSWPVYGVTFEDGGNAKLDIMELLMRLLDDMAGKTAVHVRDYALLHGDEAAFARVVRLIGECGDDKQA